MQASQAASARSSTFSLANCVQRLADHQPLSKSDTEDLTYSTLLNVSNTLAVISDSLSNQNALTDTQNIREALCFCASVLECTALISTLGD